MPERTREDQVTDQVRNMSEVTLSANEVRELIARRAYDLYKHRGTGFGDELSDWLRAEAEVVTMLLVEPQQTADTRKRNGQPAARTRNTRSAMKAGNVTQQLVSRLPKRKSVLKSNPS
jgi:hypothetical protein